MHPALHLLVSLAMFLALYPHFGGPAILVLVGGFLVDVDHYLVYVCKARNFNPVKFYRFFVPARQGLEGMLFPLHSAEFLILSIAAGLFFPAMIFFTLGLAVHYIMDICNEIFLLKKWVKNYSVIGWLTCPWRNREKAGGGT